MAEPSNLAKRIVFTGGSGVAGRHVVAKLLSYGHKILNVDTTSLDNPDVYTLKADLTDGAQAFNSLSCHFQVSEPFMEPVQTPDAVIHFAGTSTSYPYAVRCDRMLIYFRHPAANARPGQ